MKALRLPTRVSTAAYLVRFRSPRDSSSRSYLALALQEAWSLLPGPRLCREGVEHSGPLRNVSARSHDHAPFLSLLTLPTPQLRREQSPRPEFGWIIRNLCDLSKR